MDKTSTITDRVTELLAIKLYEHDYEGKKLYQLSWRELTDEDRDAYRDMARTFKPFETYRDEEKEE